MLLILLSDSKHLWANFFKKDAFRVDKKIKRLDCLDFCGLRNRQYIV